MFFTVLPVGDRPPPSVGLAFLVSDNWNDWFEFYTLFQLIVFDSAGERHDVGYVKIGQFDMVEGEGTPQVPPAFESLDGRFFSLGQDEDYYETLNKIEAALRERIFKGLRDVAADISLFERALSTAPQKKVAIMRRRRGRHRIAPGSSGRTWPSSGTDERPGSIHQ